MLSPASKLLLFISVIRYLLDISSVEISWNSTYNGSVTSCIFPALPLSNSAENNSKKLVPRTGELLIVSPNTPAASPIFNLEVLI